LGNQTAFFRRQMSPKHKAQALAITCIDYRFQKTIDEDLENRGLLGSVDRIAWPGAAKDHDSVFNAAQVSLRLHDPDQLLIYEHVDCGAYGKDNSEGTHRANAQKLAADLIKIKPELQITLLMATFEGIKEI